MSVRFKGREVTREKLLAAMARFDTDYPRPADYDDWLNDPKYRYVVHQDDKRYPPKRILGDATGLPLTAFSGGDETNRIFRQLGFKVLRIDDRAAHLLTWNPANWTWPELDSKIQRVASGEEVEESWSCSHVRRIQSGDRVFLMRLAVEPRGIVASGRVTKGSYEDIHWDPERAAQGKTIQFVDVAFDAIVDADKNQHLPRAILDEPRFQPMHWSAYNSGNSIPRAVAHELERAWAERIEAVWSGLPEEPSDSGPFVEGKRKSITVNAYERDRHARRACLKYWGARCAVCLVDLADRYGSVAKGLVHVHHLRPLSEIGSTYTVDPIEDLRPVCPNCHAVIHRRSPPYTVQEVQAMLSDADNLFAQ